MNAIQRESILFHIKISYAKALQSLLCCQYEVAHIELTLEVGLLSVSSLLKSVSPDTNANSEHVNPQQQGKLRVDTVGLCMTEKWNVLKVKDHFGRSTKFSQLV